MEDWRHYRATSISRIKRFRGTSVFEITISYVLGNPITQCFLCMTNADTCALPCGHSVCQICRKSIGDVLFKCPFCRAAIIGYERFKTIENLNLSELGLIKDENRNYRFSSFVEAPLGETNFIEFLPLRAKDCVDVNLSVKDCTYINMGLSHKKGTIHQQGVDYNSFIRYGYIVDEVSKNSISLTIRWSSLVSKIESERIQPFYFIDKEGVNRIHQLKSHKYLEISGSDEEKLSIKGLAFEIPTCKKENTFMDYVLNGLKFLENSVVDLGFIGLTDTSFGVLHNELAVINCLKFCRPSLLIETGQKEIEIWQFDDKDFLQIHKDLKDYLILNISRKCEIELGNLKDIGLLYNLDTRSYNNNLIWDFICRLLTFGEYATSHPRLVSEHFNYVDKESLVSKVITLFDNF